VKKIRKPKFAVNKSEGSTEHQTVSRIVDFGAFVEIFPGTDGLLHISEIADRRVKDVRDELKEGQQILVKCIGKEGNKIKLSRKAVLPDEGKKAEAASAGDSVSAHDAE
jgi:polyribonucleotide nucleotidyltransferase